MRAMKMIMILVIILVVSNIVFAADTSASLEIKPVAGKMCLYLDNEIVRNTDGNILYVDEVLSARNLNNHYVIKEYDPGLRWDDKYGTISKDGKITITEPDKVALVESINNKQLFSTENFNNFKTNFDQEKIWKATVSEATSVASKTDEDSAIPVSSDAKSTNSQEQTGTTSSIASIPLVQALHQRETSGGTVLTEKDAEGKTLEQLREIAVSKGIRHPGSGASGIYQFKVSTAEGLIKRTKYGSLTSDEVEKKLLTDKNFNDFVMQQQYDYLNKKYGGNEEMMALAHYSGETVIDSQLKKVFGSDVDYSNINYQEFVDGTKAGTGGANENFFTQKFAGVSREEYVKETIAGMDDGSAADEDGLQLPQAVQTEEESPSTGLKAADVLKQLQTPIPATTPLDIPKPVASDENQYYVMMPSGEYKILNDKKDYDELIKSEQFKKSGAKLGIIKAGSTQEIKDGFLVSSVREGPTVYKYGDQSLTIPTDSKIQITSKDAFYAVSAASKDGMVPKDAKISIEGGKTIVETSDKYIFSEDGKTTAQELIEGKWSETIIQSRDSANKITKTTQYDCDTIGGCKKGEIDPKDEWTSETRDSFGRMESFVRNEKNEENKIINTVTTFIQVATGEKNKDGSPKTVTAMSSVSIDNDMVTFTHPIITDDIFGITTYSTIVEGKTYDVDYDESTGEFTYEDEEGNSQTVGTLNKAQVAAIKATHKTTKHGKSNWNYFGDILNQLASATSGYKGMSFFYDEPDPFIELDGTMANLLGGIDGWTSLICQDEMTQSLDNGMAFSPYIDGAYAHVQGDKMQTINYDGSPADNYYRISVTVDPGSEANGCDMNFALVLSGGAQTIIEQVRYDKTIVESGYDDYGNQMLYETTISVVENITTTIPSIKRYLVDATGNLSQTEYMFEVKKGESALSYSGSNMIFFHDTADFNRVCLEFKDILPDSGCLIGVDKGDDICNDFSDQGTADVVDDPCEGGLVTMHPGCWGK